MSSILHGGPPEPRAARKSCRADFVCTVGVSGLSMPAFQAVRGEFKSRTVHHFLIQFRRSNQGESTAPFMRMEAGSIPAAGANLTCEASSEAARPSTG